MHIFRENQRKQLSSCVAVSFLYAYNELTSLRRNILCLITAAYAHLAKRSLPRRFTEFQYLWVDGRHDDAGYPQVYAGTIFEPEIYQTHEGSNDFKCHSLRQVILKGSSSPRHLPFWTKCCCIRNIPYPYTRPAYL